MDFKEWCFKYRSATPIGLILVLLIKGKPTPTSFYLGLILILIGETIRVLGVSACGLATRARKVCADFLTTGGVYRYSRNPLYFGNFILSCGFMIIARLFWLWPPFLILFYLQYQAIINLEEEFLEVKFPREFAEYKSAVPRFWPRFPKGSFISSGHQNILFKALINEKSTLMTLSGLLGFLFLKLEKNG